MFHKNEHAHEHDGSSANRAGSDAGADPLPPPTVNRPFEVSGGLRRVGLTSWFFVGVVVALGIVLAGVVITAGIVVPLLFSFYFGAVLFPVVDWLERRRVPRWVAALLMVLLAIALMVGAALIVIGGIAGQIPQISAGIDDGIKQVQSWLTAHNVSTPSTDQVTADVKSVASDLSGGVLSAIGSGLSSIFQLGFGLFLAINILFWVEKDGRKIGRWAAGHVGVPAEVALPILKGSVKTLQRYFYGVTWIAALNGVIVAGGAAILGTPLALVIGLVTFLAAYIPYFGAIIGGAFAVLIALGSGGTTEALWMLLIVLLANMPLQTVAQQFILGDALKLHPLSIIVITTAGGMLAGLIGSVFAAPFTKIAIDAWHGVKEAGVFDYSAGGGSPPGDEPAAPEAPDHVVAPTET